MDRFKFIENRNINGPVIYNNNDLIEIKSRAGKFLSMPGMARKIFKFKKKIKMIYGNEFHFFEIDEAAGVSDETEDSVSKKILQIIAKYNY
jgi:hypothetical protein